MKHLIEDTNYKSYGKPVYDYLESRIINLLINSENEVELEENLNSLKDEYYCGLEYLNDWVVNATVNRLFKRKILMEENVNLEKVLNNTCPNSNEYKKALNKIIENKKKLSNVKKSVNDGDIQDILDDLMENR